MPLFPFFGGGNAAFSEPAAALYRAAVAAARATPFYAALGVPDTPDGRFDMIALHVFLALRRIRRAGEGNQDAQALARKLAQALTDHVFADVDRNLRELGVGDLGVGRQVKALAAAFRGRMAAYDAALDQPGDGDLAVALGRNVFRAAEGASVPAASAKLAAYARAAEADLAAQDSAAILAGRISFPSPPAAEWVE